ncbi:UDP-galactose transporter 1-like [Hordeum vulgare]|nr:UDP-galactose transporter 1-like [Hordeum vulgare]
MGDGAAWMGQGGELEADPEGLGIADPFPVVAAAGVASTTEGELLGAAAMEDKIFEKVINPYLTEVLQHPQSIEMREGVLHIRDVEGPKKTGSMETRLEAMEQQVFKCQGMVEHGLTANHMMITEFTNKHSIDANDIGKHLSRLYDRVDQLQAQIMTCRTKTKLDFKFPLTVSCVHFICSSIGAYVAIHVLKAKPLIQVCFSFSQHFKNRSFLDAVPYLLKYRSSNSTTVILQCLVWSKHFEWRIWASLVPIVGGILLTSMTELSFNIFGFCATMIGCLATSTKTILAESLLHGYKFDSINTVYYMAPFATMILALPAMLLEGGGVIDWFYTHDVFSSLIIILGSGVLAFCLDFSIFYVIHSTTAVTFNVAGNLKVAIAVLVSWPIFRNPIPQ